MSYLNGERRIDRRAFSHQPGEERKIAENEDEYREIAARHEHEQKVQK